MGGAGLRRGQGPHTLVPWDGWEAFSSGPRVPLPLQNGQRSRMDRGSSLPSMLEQKVRESPWGGGCREDAKPGLPSSTGQACRPDDQLAFCFSLAKDLSV